MTQSKIKYLSIAAFFLLFSATYLPGASAQESTEPSEAEESVDSEEVEEEVLGLEIEVEPEIDASESVSEEAEEAPIAEDIAEEFGLDEDDDESEKEETSDTAQNEGKEEPEIVDAAEENMEVSPVAEPIPAPDPMPATEAEIETEPEPVIDPAPNAPQVFGQEDEEMTKEAPEPASPSLQPEVKEETEWEEAILRNEFHELSIAFRPGIGFANTRPAGVDKTAFTMGAHLSFFLDERWAVHVPYTYTRFSGADQVQTIGAGPLFRYLNWGYFRGEVDVNMLYARARGSNQLAWSVGADFNVGFRSVPMRPFLGPFFRYQRIALDGRDIGSFDIGVGLTLTNLVDKP